MLEKIDLNKKISKKEYKKIFPRLRMKLYALQKASWDAEIPVIILFEGWDAAGKGTSIQDNCTVHVTPFNPTIIGEYVTVGHNSVIHACEIGDRTAIGMGAVVLTGAKVGADCVIGAGSVVTENKVIPDNSLVLGVPGKVVKEVSEGMKEAFMIGAEMYVELGRRHKATTKAVDKA